MKARLFQGLARTFAFAQPCVREGDLRSFTYLSFPAFTVISTEAGTHTPRAFMGAMDSRLRGNDGGRLLSRRRR